MHAQILFVPDFARRFFVRCAQIHEAYLDDTLIKFVCIWRKISRKSRYKRDSESTFWGSVGRKSSALQISFRPPRTWNKDFCCEML